VVVGLFRAALQLLSLDVQRPARETVFPVDLEKGRGRFVDRRWQSVDDEDQDGARRLAELVASSLEADHDDSGGGGGGGSIRVYHLYNRCSMKYVRVAGKRVDAGAPHDDIYSTSVQGTCRIVNDNEIYTAVTRTISGASWQLIHCDLTYILAWAAVTTLITSVTMILDV